MLQRLHVGARIIATALLAIVLGVVPTLPAAAEPDPALTGGTAVTGYSGTATPITDLQVAGTGNPTVPVKLLVTNGTLTMTTTTGLTFTGGSTGATLQFSGTLTNVNAALATLQYTRNSTGTDTLEASLVNAGEVFFPGNGHLYEYVSYTASWTSANTNAGTRSKYGATGYLATITSQAENDFVSERLLNAGWMGASDVAAEGDWKWVTGPENGTSFWSGAASGSAVGGRYANWNTGEPNDSSGNEDCGQFLAGGTGKWNDLPCSGSTLPGYVAEYGSSESPIDISSKNVSITTLAPNQYPVVGSLGPAASTDGSWSTDTTPDISFSVTDPDVSDTVRYRVQIDDSADFTSPVVDYTSALGSQGSKTFTVGQAVGSGTYTVGSAGQTLADGSYYWRVRGLDTVAAASAYTIANSGGVAFKVDASTPTAPGAPATAQAVTTNAMPEITWDASTDSGIGLDGTAPYTVEWSQNNAFSTVTSSPATTNSFTVPISNALADGTWYFRVKAKDGLANTTAYSALLTITVDTTPPSTPGTPTLTTAANDNTPSFSWAASTDATAGLATTPYTVQWSRQADFSSVTTASAATLSFTFSAALADGTWYFRVKAADVLGNASAYSPVKVFTIDTTPPPAPAAVTPPAPVVTPAPVFATVSQVEESAQQTPPTDPQSGETLVLNNFNEYTQGDGKDLALKIGQVIYFFIGNEQHTITIKEIHDTYVLAVVASTPTEVRIPIGQPLSYDADDDGKSDIVMSLTSTQNGVADMMFKLPEPATVAATSEPQQTQAPAYNPWPLLLVVPLLAMIAWLAIRRRKQNK